MSNKNYEIDFFELSEEMQDNINFFSENARQLKAAKLFIAEADKKKKEILVWSLENQVDGETQAFLNAEGELVLKVNFETNGQGKKWIYNIPFLKHLWRTPKERLKLKDFFKLDLVPINKLTDETCKTLNSMYDKKLVKCETTGKEHRQRFTIL